MHLASMVADPSVKVKNKSNIKILSWCLYLFQKFKIWKSLEGVLVISNYILLTILPPYGPHKGPVGLWFVTNRSTDRQKLNIWYILWC